MFSLARITGNPLDNLLSFETTPEDRERIAAAWRPDRLVHVQYFNRVGNARRGVAGDFPVIQTVVLQFSIIYIFTNLIIDNLYAYLDPRIRYS